MLAPAKTFIIGEYGVLSGGSALIITHAPYFQLKTKPSTHLDLGNIHPASPAGKLLLDNIHHTTFEFIDPYASLGGLGASSAQFLLAYNFIKPPTDLLTTYKHYAGTKPSGADVLAQTQLGLSWVTPGTSTLQAITWPFPDITCLLFKTPHKIPTHTHLDQLPQTDFTELNHITHGAYQALVDQQPKAFITHIKQFSAHCAELNLTLASSCDYIQTIEQQTGVYAAKGCGALGADVIAVFCDPVLACAIKTQCENLNLIFIAAPIHFQPQKAAREDRHRDNNMVCASTC